MIRLAPEGWPFVLPGLALTAVATLVAVLVPSGGSFWSWVAWSVAGLSGAVTALVAFFFRDPVRRRPGGEGLVLAPADGRVIQITPMDGPELWVRPATRVSIFLSIFDVHIQRAPITGRVELKEYRAGGFALAWHHDASETNEQATIGISAGPHRVMVRQIAGMVARRIVTDAKEGDLVPQGSRIGIIRFGSRVDLFIPQDWDLTCRIGDRARAGLTALARRPRMEEPEGP